MTDETHYVENLDFTAKTRAYVYYEEDIPRPDLTEFIDINTVETHFRC
jgi:hypothetical protein